MATGGYQPGRVFRTVALSPPSSGWSGGRAGSGRGRQTLGRDQGWGERAKCRTADPEELFVEGAAQARAKELCSGCQVRTECLAHSLDHRVEFGVWGGMTERERRALLKRRPTVTSWQRLLEAARSEYEDTSQVGPAAAS
ncbi:WhiB family transcriptional regulator [Streptomyces sp. NBC_01294]|uniref:WhiB family transcriptional regulator n=1 Tax=Streptomyces sp. NBC_01294 TaxID=2903815 RepID=UPI003FA3C0A6